MTETIRLNFYQAHLDLPAYKTPQDAQVNEFVQSPNMFPRGYAVLFELNGLYAVYIHPEDRYYSSYLPDKAKVLAGGWWEKGKAVEWQQIGKFSLEERRLAAEHGYTPLLDELERHEQR